jgi:hypothetical protein
LGFNKRLFTQVTMAEEVVTQAATQAAEAAEQVIHHTVETAATQSYVGLFGTFNWLVSSAPL